MARKKSSLNIALEYYLARTTFEILRVLPLYLAVTLCRIFLQISLFMMPKRVNVMTENLTTCFPHLDDPQRDRIAMASLDNLARGLAIFPRLPDWVRRRSDRWILFEGFEHAHEARARGQGVIAFTAHYGFWEAIAVYLPRVLASPGVVARPVANPRLNAFMTQIRTSGGTHVISRREILRDGLKSLQQKGFLGLLIDQHLGSRAFVDYFGRPAGTSTVVSLLARQANAVMVPIRSRWEGWKLRVTMEPPIPLSPNPDQHNAVKEDSLSIAKVVGDWISEDPTQWLWINRRWKNPDGDASWNRISGSWSRS